MSSSNDAVPKPAAAPAPAFSYAQAARGLASTASSVQSSRGTSGAITPAKDSVASPVALPETPAWTESNAVKAKDPTSAPVPEPNDLSLSKSAPARKSLAQSNGSISPPSSAYVDSSMSTLPREDDLSSIPNASSESTWENVSTASNAAERGSESDAKQTKPEINGEREPGWVQVSKPSPQPTFNFWEQRKQDRAAKNSAPEASADAAVAKPQPPPPAAAKAAQEQSPPRKDAEKPKRDHRSEDEPRGRRQGAKKTVPDEKPVAPPAINDANLWPTVEVALDNGRKRSQDKPEKTEKAEKAEKAEKEKPAAKKLEWKKVEVQHSVVFNTPLPTSHRGRGGRPTGRGGREGGTRTSPGGSEKQTGDSKPRSTSPGKGKRAVGDDSHAKREARYPGRDNQKDSQFGDRPSGRQNSDDRNGSGPYGTFPRVKTNRKLDGAADAGRKDGRVISDLSNGEGLAIENANPPSQVRSSQVHSDDERKPANDGNSRSQRNGAPYAANRRGSLRRHAQPHGFHGSPSAAFQPSGFNMARSPTLPHDGYYTPGPRNQLRGQRNQMHGDSYGRFGAPYSAVLPQINTFMGQPVGAYDYQSPHPVSAGPYPPYMDQYTHIGMVAHQLEYYFSVSNLCRDLYLRSHMDSQGFVLLSVIANFNRIKELNSSLEQLKLVCQQSQILEWRLGVDGKDRIRKREGWDKWVVEMAKRDASAQHDGIEAASPAPPNPEGFVPVRHSSLPNSLSPHMSPAMVMVPMNGSGYLPELLRSPTGENADFSGFQTSPPMNPLYSPPGNMEQQPVKAPGYIPSGAPGGENDNLSDAQVDNLMVMVRPGLPNGHQKTEEPKANGVSGPSVVPSHEVEAANPGSAEASSHFRSTPSWSGEVFWAKDRDSPLSEWPEHASGEAYVDMRASALEQRQKSAADNYPDDMVVLYQFWSHFLVRNFNTRMFLEFHQLAEEDKERGVADGMQNLVKYYAAALLHHMPLREVVLTHLMELVKMEKESDGQMPVLKILRSAWRNGTLNPVTREKIRDSAEAELISTLDA